MEDSLRRGESRPLRCWYVGVVEALLPQPHPASHQNGTESVLQTPQDSGGCACAEWGQLHPFPSPGLCGLRIFPGVSYSKNAPGSLAPNLKFVSLCLWISRFQRSSVLIASRCADLEVASSNLPTFSMACGFNAHNSLQKSIDYCGWEGVWASLSPEGM